MSLLGFTEMPISEIWKESVQEFIPWYPRASAGRISASPLAELKWCERCHSVREEYYFY